MTERQPTHRVALRRANGRLVRDYPAWSRYAAKKMKERIEERYAEPCPDWYVEVTPWPAEWPLAAGYQLPPWLHIIRPLPQG